VSKETLLATAEEWLLSYLTDVKSPKDLKKINLSEVLEYHLSFDQQTILKQLAPANLEVPSGSSIQLLYRSSGEVPVLAVRLQELFGLAETPTVNQGKNSVLIHLLSPGYKPVQVTADLKNFWNETYFEVRKELKRKYPKHSWPEDPWNAEAVRGVKRKA
jgi:ATP-dependent helicase HrpB